MRCNVGACMYVAGQCKSVESCSAFRHSRHPRGERSVGCKTWKSFSMFYTRFKSTIPFRAVLWTAFFPDPSLLTMAGGLDVFTTSPPWLPSLSIILHTMPWVGASPPPGQRRSVELRGINSACKRTCTGTSAPLIWRSNRCTASSPSRSNGGRILVRPIARAKARSSKPISP